MKKFIWLMMLLVMGMFGSVFPTLAQPDIAQIGLAVVQISVYQGSSVVSSGSGTIVEPTGKIFTNWHVVNGGDDFEIAVLEDIRERPVARYYATLVESYEEIDFAILQIDRNIRGRTIAPDTLDLPFVALATDDVSHGDRVTVFGYPSIGNGFLVVTSGSITTIQNGRVNGESTPVVYQIDAEIAPGNSGGLAINQNGEMVGIPFYVSGERRTGGRLGEIIPIALVVVLLDDTNIEIVATGRSNLAGTRPPATGGLAVDCGDGRTIVDGVGVTIVQMRSGFSYTVTVVGLNGFEPILAEVTQFGRTKCVDSPSAPSNFSFSLPTTGFVTQPSNSIRYNFSQNTGQGMADMMLVVGGKNATFGEFVLVLEGMAYTEFDGTGDPILLSITPRMMASAVPTSIYMIGMVNALDPLILVNNGTSSFVLCDDAGVPTNCPFGQSLVGSYVTRANGNRLDADSLDAMFSIPFRELPGLDVTQTTPFPFFMSSSNFASYGHYIFVLHTSTR